MVLDWFRNAFGPAQSLALHQVQLAVNDERARLTRYQQGWDAYYGRYPRPLTVKPGRPDDNLLANKARVIVDTGVAFLFGEDVRFEIERRQTTPTEQWLDACWQANRKMLTLQKLAVNGAVCGTAFLRIALRPEQGAMPRLVVLDPAHVHVRWDADDVDTVVAYRIQYPAIDPATGKPIIRRQEIDRDGAGWQIVDQVARPDSTVWETLATTAWPWPFSPIVHCQNLPVPNDFWGLSDLEDDILRLVQARNFVLSNTNRILYYHAHPKTWGKGFAAGDLQIAPDETAILPGKDAELNTLEMQSDLSSSLNFDRRIDEALHEISRIPAIATGKVENIGQLSGLALQILYRPLVQLTETKRLTYGDLLAEANRRLLAMAGFAAYDSPLQVHLLWPDLLPGDPKQERETAVLDQQLGVSRATTLERLGYDPVAEAAQRALEAAEATVALAATSPPNEDGPDNEPADQEDD